MAEKKQNDVTKNKPVEKSSDETQNTDIKYGILITIRGNGTPAIYPIGTLDLIQLIGLSGYFNAYVESLTNTAIEKIHSMSEQPSKDQKKEGNQGDG